MIVLGLTGSMAMGKTTIASMLQHMHIPVHDSDIAVHNLLRKDMPLITQINTQFPGSVKKNVVDRKALGKEIFFNDEKRLILESLLHPLVQQSQQKFLHKCRLLRCDIAVLDIPLLFETGADKRCDYVMVASAPYHIQKTRALRRPGMTEDKFNRILAAQMPDTEKCLRADIVIPTGLGHAYSYKLLKKFISAL